MPKTKTALVAGGAGFIGSNLCRKLLNEGYRVICVDNFYSGKKENIDVLLSNENFIFIEDDVAEPFNVSEKLDEVYNLACPASPKFYQKDPVYTLKTNVVGTMNLLELARKNDAVFFQASTSEIYGNPAEHPQKENYFGNVNPVGLRSCYDEGKRAAECLCFDYNRMFGTKIKVARIFNCYGQYMRKDDGRIICTFINQALRGKPLLVFGDGNQTRSLCHIDDLLDGISKLMASSDDFMGPVNLGNPEEKTVNEIAQLIIEVTGRCAKIEYFTLPKDEPLRRKPNISLAKEILAFEPKIDLKTGITKMIEFIKTDGDLWTL